MKVWHDTYFSGGPGCKLLNVFGIITVQLHPVLNVSFLRVISSLFTRISGESVDIDDDDDVEANLSLFLYATSIIVFICLQEKSDIFPHIAPGFIHNNSVTVSEKKEKKYSEVKIPEGVFSFIGCCQAHTPDNGTLNYFLINVERVLNKS